MADPNDYERELLAQVDIEIDKGLRAVKRAVNSGLRYLVEISPDDTGWYKRNHRYSLNLESVETEPEARPTRGGASIALSPTAMVSREAPKLDELKLGDTISIINAVPYGDLIEVRGTETAPEGAFYARTEQYIKGLLNRPLTTSEAQSGGRYNRLEWTSSTRGPTEEGEE